MSANQPSKQWGYKLGQLLGLFFVGAVAYGSYGLLYWAVTDKLYFGPWEWGLCLLTGVLTSVVARVENYAEKKETKLRAVR